jgi:acetoacetyl-CoA reductase
MSRLAIVTGGTRGIGKAISLKLKDAGYQVVATYAGNDDLAQEFSEQSAIKIYKWNVADYEECQENVEKITKDFKKNPEILINNAGITRDKMMHKLDKQLWDDVIDVNLTSCFNMCKAVIGFMREQNYGRIVNISSINALSGQVGQTNYSAAKAGIIGFSKSLARESARKNITVNVVAPGYIRTEMIEAVPDNIMEGIIKQIPVGRLGKPDEIARAVAFLVDDDSGFITGETLSINGGQHME